MSINENILVVYSGYRCSSTWFWSRLRKSRILKCYYEVFNEALSSISLENVTQSKPTAWRSRHPDEAGYHFEYVPLIADIGVPGFPKEETPGCRFIGHAGVDGPLDDDVRDYLESLVRFARAQGHIPVLSCTRMLARSTGLRQSFPGLHILLVRNLFQQWNSYSGQHRTGNTYFLDTLFSTLSLAGKDPYIDYLVSLFDVETKNSLETWIRKENYDKVFCYFIAFHIYFLLHTRRNVDLVVDINALSDPTTGYRQNVEEQIRAAAGIDIDLSHAKEAIDYPQYLVRAPDECRHILRGMVEKAHDILRSTEEERAFASQLLQDLWKEHDLFSFYTAGANEAIAASGAAMCDTIDRMDLALKAERAALCELHEILDQREREAGVLRDGIEAVNGEVSEVRQQLQQVMEELSDARDAEHRAHAEKSMVANEVASLREVLAQTQQLLDEERSRFAALVVEHGKESSLEREKGKALVHELATLNEVLAETRQLLDEERGQHSVVAIERARLYENLELDGGPMALRAVLPVARALRPVIRLHGRIKRTLRNIF